MTADSLYARTSPPRSHDSAAITAWPCLHPVLDASSASGPDSPVTYTVALSKGETFAMHGTAKGPKGILQKERMKKLLGLGPDS